MFSAHNDQPGVDATIRDDEIVLHASIEKMLSALTKL